jgi:hypothetical protein
MAGPMFVRPPNRTPPGAERHACRVVSRRGRHARRALLDAGARPWSRCGRHRWSLIPRWRPSGLRATAVQAPPGSSKVVQGRPGGPVRAVWDTRRPGRRPGRRAGVVRGRRPRVARHRPRSAPDAFRGGHPGALPGLSFGYPAQGRNPAVPSRAVSPRAVMSDEAAGRSAPSGAPDRVAHGRFCASGSQC